MSYSEDHRPDTASEVSTALWDLGVVTIDNWDIRNLPGIGGGVAELGRSHI